MNLFSSDFLDSLRDLGNGPGGPESLMRAYHTNSWGLGGGVTGNQNTHTSWDDILGGWGADNAGARRVGRGVGLAFAGYAGGAALGAGESGAAAEAPTELGIGTPAVGDTTVAQTGLTEPAADAATSPIGDQTLTAGVQNAPEAIINDGAAPVDNGAIDTSQIGGNASQSATENKGLISQAMDWVNAKPVNTLVAGKAVEGVATGLAASRAAEKKRKAEEALQNERLNSARLQKQGNPSVGGGGVNLNLRPGPNGVLLRPDGSPVYPQPGLINGGMNGVRG